MKFSGVLLLTLLLFSICFAQNDAEQSVKVLQGFDAVALVEGRQIKGKETISVSPGRFKYLFANQANKRKFEPNPEIYEVQKNGECTFMPGDPDLWEVYGGKIYLFGTSLCRERFRLSPETILYPEKREKIKVRNVAIVIYDGVELLDFENGDGNCTNGTFDYTGLSEFTGKKEDMGKFKIPTLRNVELTAPYMHDGSIATLEDVIEHYKAGGRTIKDGKNAGNGNLNPLKSSFVRGFDLSSQEKPDLIAFLKSLTDTEFINNPKLSNLWEKK